MKRLTMLMPVAALLAGCATKCNCDCDACCGDEVPAICTDEEIAEGFVPLYNGHDLTGWTATKSQTAYAPVKRGVLAYDHLKGGAFLWTDKDYSDFILRFEFKLSCDCNNGLAVRTPFGKHAASQGLEIQMLDDEGDMYTTTFPQLGFYQKACCRHGSVYGVIAPKFQPDGRSYLKPVGEWNTEEVTLIGSKIKVVLNGTVILDDDLSRYPTDGTTMDGNEHPGLRNKTGRLAWLSHGYPCWWRNIRIREIK